MSVSDFSDERGLFGVHPEADRRGYIATATHKRKNVDFLRLKDVALHLLAPQTGMTILDLGCASGTQMIYCGLQGATVYGQDLDPTRIEIANRKLAELHLAGEARIGPAESLTFPDNIFDAVISSDFHEHLSAQSQIAVLTESRRVLKPGGILVLKTPNLRYLHLSLAFKRLRAVVKGRSPYGYVIPHTIGTTDPQHIGLITRPRLSRQLAEAGFLNWTFHYAPLRRFGMNEAMAIASTEVVWLRDWLCEDLFCRAYKPIALSHFPD